MVKVLDDFDPDRHLLLLLDAAARRSGRELGDRIGPSIPGMRGSFGMVLGRLPAEGARPSELAELAGITKQAMGQRLVELEARGWIRVDRDPDDRRARLVRRTPEGDAVRVVVAGAIAAAVADWAERVGADRYATCKAVLAELGGIGPDDR